MNERRLQRLESTIKAKVAAVLVRDMSDPRLGIVTVTRVQLDRELTLCKIYWSVLGGEKERKVNERVLQHAAGWMRREVAEVMRTRTVPRVEFVFDERIVGAMRIDSILKNLRDERSARAEPLEPVDAHGEPLGDAGSDKADPDEDDLPEDDPVDDWDDEDSPPPDPRAR